MKSYRCSLCRRELVIGETLPMAVTGGTQLVHMVTTSDELERLTTMQRMLSPRGEDVALFCGPVVVKWEDTPSRTAPSASWTMLLIEIRRALSVSFPDRADWMITLLEQYIQTAKEGERYTGRHVLAHIELTRANDPDVLLLQVIENLWKMAVDRRDRDGFGSREYVHTWKAETDIARGEVEIELTARPKTVRQHLYPDGVLNLIRSQLGWRP